MYSYVILPEARTQKESTALVIIEIDSNDRAASSSSDRALALKVLNTLAQTKKMIIKPIQFTSHLTDAYGAREKLDIRMIISVVQTIKICLDVLDWKPTKKMSIDADNAM